MSSSDAIHLPSMFLGGCKQEIVVLVDLCRGDPLVIGAAAEGLTECNGMECSLQYETQVRE